MTQGFYEQLGVDPSSSATDVRAAYMRLVAGLARRKKAIIEQGGDPSPLDLSRTQADEAFAVLSDPARRRRYDAMRAVVEEGGALDPNEVWKRASGALVTPAAGAAADLLRHATTLKVGVLPPPPGPTHSRSSRPAQADAPATGSGAPSRGRSGATEPTAPPKAGRKVDENTVTQLHTDPARRPPPKASAASSERAGASAPAPEASRRASLGFASLGRGSREEDGADDAPADATPVRPTRIAVPGPSGGERRAAQVVPIRPETTQTAPSSPGLKVVDGSKSGAPVVVMPTAPKRATRQLAAEDVARLVDKHGWSGALLGAVREARALSLQEMSETTRISVKYLEAIEGDRHENLPSSTFVRGYVREMARMLGLDEEAAVTGYMRRIQ